MWLKLLNFIHVVPFFGVVVLIRFTDLLFDCIHFLHVFVEYMLLDKLGSFELLSTEGTEILVFCDLLCVHLNETLHFSEAVCSQGTNNSE